MELRCCSFYLNNYFQNIKFLFPNFFFIFTLQIKNINDQNYILICVKWFSTMGITSNVNK